MAGPRVPPPSPKFVRLTSRTGTTSPLSSPTSAPRVPTGRSTPAANPGNCPPSTWIGAKITAFYVAAHSGDTDTALKMQGQLTAYVGCMSSGQLAKFTAAGDYLNARTHKQESNLGGNIHPTGWISGFFGELVPILMIAAGGLGLLVVGLALVYVAGRNTGVGKAAGAVGAPARTAAKLARRAAPERSEARRIAAGTRRRERTERAASRVSSGSRVRYTKRGLAVPQRRVRVTSRRSGAEARQLDAEYRASAGTRQRERLGAFRQEQERKLRVAS